MLSHGSLLETIEVKGAGMTEHYVTQLEFQDLQEQYGAIRERTKVWLTVFHADPLKEGYLELCLLKTHLFGGNDRLVKANRTKKAKWILILGVPYWQSKQKLSTIVRIWKLLEENSSQLKSPPNVPIEKKIEGSFIRKNHKYLHISGDENFLKQGKIANNIYHSLLKSHKENKKNFSEHSLLY